MYSKIIHYQLWMRFKAFQPHPSKMFFFSSMCMRNYFALAHDILKETTYQIPCFNEKITIYVIIIVWKLSTKCLLSTYFTLTHCQPLTLCTGSQGDWSQSRGTPWTGHQSIAGTTIHTHTDEPAYIWTVGGRWSTEKIAMQTQGEPANSTQKGQARLRIKHRTFLLSAAPLCCLNAFVSLQYSVMQLKHD